jgi:hypothetical protein
MSSPYARLDVLLAREGRFGLVIRQGTAKSVCTLLWDRTNDRFTLGQWMRGRIDVQTCDLSPDGQYFLYSARRYVVRAGELHQWTVVSRTPYLKAVAYYPSRFSGGWFVNNREYSILTRGVTADDRESPEISRVEAVRPKGSLHEARMLRDGWTLDDRRESFGDRFDFVRDAGSGWELRQFPSGRYRLSRGEHTAASRDWVWADVDGNRVVWAAKGCLWAGIPRRESLEDIRLLHDFNAMKFEALAAPYEGGRPIRIAKPAASPQPTPRPPLFKRPHKPRRPKPDRSRVRFEEDEL